MPYFLRQCILGIQAASKNIITEIIVVDNNSSDESCTMIRNKFPEVKLIENKKNIGFSKANNLGVAVAEGEFVLIINPDTVLAEDTFDKVLDFAEKQKDLGAIGIKFIDGTGNFLPECKRNIPTIRIANQKIRGNSQKYYANHIDENEIAKVEILTGAFMLIKREVYLKVGGFDEDYFMFGEDIDLSYKLLNNGFQNFYFGKTTMIHYKGESTVKDLTYLKNFYNAMQIFYKKYYKINVFSNFISKMAVKMMVLLKSSVKQTDIKNDNKFFSLLYIGNSESIFKKLENKVKPQSAEKSNILPNDCLSFDTVIFDNTFVSNKEIIENIMKLKAVKISKRIIPKGTSFFIGSDSSIGRGEEVEF